MRKAEIPNYTKAQEMEFCSLISSHRGYIFHFINKYQFIKYHEREDYFQEIAILAWSRYHLYLKGWSSFRNFIADIAKWAILSKRRDYFRHDHLFYLTDSFFSWEIADEQYEEENIDLLNKAIEDLPSEDQTIVRLVLQYDNMGEVAKKLGRTKFGIQAKMNRIRNRLRQYSHVYFDEKPKPAENLRGQKNAKPVGQFDLDGNLLKRWLSAPDAGRSGFLPQSIFKVASGKMKTHKGYIWKYLDQN